MKKNWFLYIAYLFYFLWIWLQSGSIVHLIVNPKLYIILYFVWVLLFWLWAYLQKIENTTHASNKELFRYIIFSSLFSMWIGLISWSIQHFSDIWFLASIYIPVWMILSSVFYFKKEKHALNKWHLLVFILALATGFWLQPFTWDKIPTHWHDEETQIHTENIDTSHETSETANTQNQETESAWENINTDTHRNNNENHDANPHID